MAGGPNRRHRLTPAQKRFLRRLFEEPDYTPQQRTTRATRRALLRHGYIRQGRGGRLVPLFDVDEERWV